MIYIYIYIWTGGQLKRKEEDIERGLIYFLEDGDYLRVNTCSRREKRVLTGRG